MINNVSLTGRLTKDVELTQTGSGISVARFTLAVNRTYANQDGEREADFINCVMWRKSAEALTQYCHKGSLIGIVGRIQTGSYENAEGQRIYTTEVNASEFTFLESKNQGNNNESNQPNPNTFNQPQTSVRPAYQPQAQSNRWANTKNTATGRGDINTATQNINQTFSDPFTNVNVSDADLPF